MNYDLTGIILEFFLLSIAGIAFGFVVTLSVLGARLLIMSATAKAEKVGEISKIPGEEPCPHCGEHAAEDYDQRGRP